MYSWAQAHVIHLVHSWQIFSWVFTKHLHWYDPDTVTTCGTTTGNTGSKRLCLSPWVIPMQVVKSYNRTRARNKRMLFMIGRQPGLIKGSERFGGCGVCRDLQRQTDLEEWSRRWRPCWGREEDEEMLQFKELAVKNPGDMKAQEIFENKGNSVCRSSMWLLLEKTANLRSDDEFSSISKTTGSDIIRFSWLKTKRSRFLHGPQYSLFPASVPLPWWHG